MKTEKSFYSAPLVTEEEFAVEAGIAQTAAFGEAGAPGGTLDFESDEAADW